MLSGCINLSEASGNLSDRQFCGGKPAYLSHNSEPCRFTFFKQSF